MTAPDDTTAPVPADDLRARLIAAELAVVHELTPEGRPNFLMRGNIEAADLAIAVLAEPATDPGDLTARMAPVVQRWVREIDEDRSDDADTATADEMTAELLSIRDERVVHLAARLAEAERRAEQAEEARKSIGDHHTTWEREKARADRAEEQLREERNRHRVAAEKDVCPGCMQREEQRDAAWETSRQNGIKYEQMKQAWYREQDRARAAEAQVAALQRERHATLTAIHAARMAHIREVHPTRIVAGDEACQAFVAISRDLPSRPDDPEEIRRLAQAATEETSDG